MLELEAKRKEEQLIELRKAMQVERQLKMKNQAKNGNHWRSATNKKKLFGYSDLVLDHYSKESTTDGSNLASAQSNRSKASGKPKNIKGKENITQGLKFSKVSTSKNNNIVSNFEKAIVQQNSENDEVGHFLSQIKMEKYKQLFFDNGVEDKETILELNESHLQELGLPLGHKLKIMKRIKEWKKQMDTQVTPQIQANAQPQKVSSGTATSGNSNSLLNGEYDEEANKAEFQEALNAWRNAGKKNQDTKSLVSVNNKPPSYKSKKTVRFAEDPPEEVLILDENPNEELKEDDTAIEIKSVK